MLLLLILYLQYFVGLCFVVCIVVLLAIFVDYVDVLTIIYLVCVCGSLIFGILYCICGIIDKLMWLLLCAVL